MSRAVFWDLDGTLLRWKSSWVIPRIVAARYLRYLREGYPLGGLRALLAYLSLFRSVDPDGLKATFARRVTRVTGLDEEEFWIQEEAFSQGDLRPLCTWIEPVPEARDLVQSLEAQGAIQVAATNPNMLQSFQVQRLAWAGYDLGAFAWVTGLDVSSRLKPHPSFYQDILDQLNLRPEDCLMVGNDPQKDLTAAELGIPVFLLTGQDRQERPFPPGLSPYREGTYRDLAEVLELFLQGRMPA